MKKKNESRADFSDQFRKKLSYVINVLDIT